VPTRASGQLAVPVYQLDQAGGVFEPLALDVITLEGPRVAAVTAFRTPELFARFGLPESLPA
jgi:RNA polymerase sigma-70 factor (ECF subfamily)